MDISKIVKAVFSGNAKGHFGQWAEDVLVRKLFDRKKKTGTYLDLGAFHPFQHSNTAFFWLKGWHGYNVDANPATIKLYEKTRPGDVNIWAAIIPEVDYQSGTRTIDLLLPSREHLPNGVSTTGTVNPHVGSDRNFKDKLPVPAKSIMSILSENGIKTVDYMNIDIEGYDEAIIKDIDFSTFRPTVISVEDYSDDLALIMESAISKTLFANGYKLVGRAGLTSIFKLANAL
jgi:Methyltransferase FkbM domain